MLDLIAISGLLTGVKTAANMTQALLELKVESEVRGKVVELQSVILSARESAVRVRSALLASSKRIEELEKELATLHAWEAEKKRYAVSRPTSKRRV
jgi:uncharacterized coiled-coil DUF342 family protein